MLIIYLNKIKYKIIQSLFLYIWFIVVMRAPAIITLITILILCVIFLIDEYITSLKNQIKKHDDTKQTPDEINQLI